MVSRTLRVSTLVFPLLLLASTMAAQELPSKISDEAFWQLVTDLSEPDGMFPSDNFVSNELFMTDVMQDLKKRVPPGGIYLGVGPEQNFTYMAAIQPRMAFIIDIRRQNLVEHLLYKALFELSTDRREFMSRLFSRELPAATQEPANLQDILTLLRSAPVDVAFFATNLSAIRTHLTETHGFKLTASDQSSLEYILRAFFILGPDINYNGPPARNPNGVFPTYAQLLLERPPAGRADNFLSTEDSFRIVQKLQKDNMIVPLVGNFAGPSAIRAVADYLRKYESAISTVYVSNVEQYLFQDLDNWRIFYHNLGSVPRDSRSVLIRTLLQKDTGQYSDSPAVRPGYGFRTMLFSIPDLIATFELDGVKTYADAVHTGNLTNSDASTMEVETTPSPGNVGVVLWPNLRPPSRLRVISVSPSEIRLEWPNTGRGDKTAFRISKQIAGEWAKPVRATYASVCGSDPCIFRDSNVSAGTRYCYFVEAATDYSDLGAPLEDDYGEPSMTVCVKP